MEVKKRNSECIDNLYTYNECKHNYEIENIYISAWENIQYPESVNNFYIHNGYQKLDKNPVYYDNKIDLFEINRFFKKL